MSDLCWEKSSCGIGPCGLPKGHEGLHELRFRGGLARWKDGERPVSPATTAAIYSGNCLEHPFSSRACEKGTKGCNVHHDKLTAEELLEKLVGIGQEAAEKQQEKDRLIIGQIADWICGKRISLQGGHLGQLVIALTECIEKQSNEPFNEWLKSYNSEVAERLAK